MLVLLLSFPWLALNVLNETIYNAIFSAITGDLNDAGRGINFVVVHPDTKEVVRVARFDTFASGTAAVFTL